MKRIAIALSGIVLVPSVLWLSASMHLLRPDNFFELREAVMQYSGVLAISCMSVAMLLALRPSRPERWLGGLDKMYRLHKWLGIGALTIAVFHWLWAEGPKWAVDAGLLEPPERGEWPTLANPVEQLFADLRGAAEGVGEWTFYAAALLIVLALTKRFPYRLFARTHRLLAIAYLILVFHAIVLLDFASWASPLGLLVMSMLAAAAAAAVVVLFRHVGMKRRIEGAIETVRFHAGIRSVEVEIALPPGWPGHEAGQFAFVTFDPSEGPHPFTIVSAWNETDRRVAFIIKELGDYTRGLCQRLHSGQPVTIEGPYGRFVFDDDRRHQIWVGGGVGITPFISRMKHIAARAEPSIQAIDLFHCTRDYDQEAIARLTADATAAGICLHVLVDSRDGYLDGEKIRAAVPQWREASLWFCGPSGLGRNLRRDFAVHGLPVTQRFHQELFAMR